jgi:hypothetical protein
VGKGEGEGEGRKGRERRQEGRVSEVMLGGIADRQPRREVDNGHVRSL